MLLEKLGGYVLLMAAGYFLRRLGTSKRIFRLFNRAVFYLLFPLVVVYNIWSSQGSGGIDGAMLGFSLAAVTATVAAGFFLWRRAPVAQNQKPVMIQAMFRCGVTTYTMTFFLPLIPPEERGAVLLCTTLVTTFFNLPSVLVFSAFDPQKGKLGKRLWEAVKNPCLIACAAGGLLLLSPLSPPEGLEPAVEAVREVSGVLTFLCVGASLQGGLSQAADGRLVLTGVLLRLAVVPLLGLTAAVVLGFRGWVLLVFCGLFSGACTANGHVIALEMGGDGPLSGKLVCLTQILAPFVIMGWALALDQLGFL